MRLWEVLGIIPAEGEKPPAPDATLAEDGMGASAVSPQVIDGVPLRPAGRYTPSPGGATGEDSSNGQHRGTGAPSRPRLPAGAAARPDTCSFD